MDERIQHICLKWLPLQGGVHPASSLPCAGIRRQFSLQCTYKTLPRRESFIYDVIIPTQGEFVK